MGGGVALALVSKLVLMHLGLESCSEDSYGR